MNKKLRVLHKIVSFISGLSLIFNSLFPTAAVFAQEATPTPEPTPTETVAPTPTIEPTATPTPEITPTITETSTETPTPTEEPTPSPAPEELTPTPTEVDQPTETGPPSPAEASAQEGGQILDGVSTEAPTPTETITPTPTITPEETETGTVSIIDNSPSNLQQLDLSTYEPTSGTLKKDFAPTDPVLIIGTGFKANHTYILTINSEDQPPITNQTIFTVNTDNEGVFFQNYTLDGNYRPNYKIVVTNQGGKVIAETTFTDSASLQFHQCANENPTLGSCDWIGSILQNTNSAYTEGMSVPQRLILKSVDSAPGDIHTLTFSHQATKGGNHAYDFLTAYNQGNNPALTLNPCDDLNPSDTILCNLLRSGGNTQTPNVPDDPFISADGSTQSRIDAYELVYGNRTIQIYGNAAISSASFSSISHDVANGADTGDSYTLYTLTWTSSSSNVLIEMAGHLSMGVNPSATGIGWGSGNGAGSVSGGPYHFKLDQLDGDSLGSQDNQIQADDVAIPGSITIVKQAYPEGSSVFNYTGSPSPLVNFSLTDDGTSANTQTFPNITNFTTYTITETPIPAGWGLTDISCTDPTGNSSGNTGTGVATINLAEGENVTCTFTNTQVTGSITIVKDADPNDPQDFSFTGDLGSFALDDDADGTLPNSQIFSGLVGGTYVVTEGSLSDWDLTGLACNDTDGGTTTDLGTQTATIDLDFGQNLTCTFTNTKRGTIIVEKQTNPDAAGGNFTFTGTAAGTISDGGQIVVNNLAPGQYTSTETNPTPAFDLTGISCDDTTNGGQASTGDTGTKTATFNLDPGETVTCTFTNTQRGSISGYKYEDADGNPATLGDQTVIEGWTIELWKLVNQAYNFFDSTLTDVFGFFSFTNLAQGDYEVREVVPPLDWTALSPTGIPVNLSPGEDSEDNNFVNFENVSITVCKAADPDGNIQTESGRTNVSGWQIDLTKDGQSFDSQDTGKDGCYTWTNLGPGDYSATEETQPGWTNLNPTTHNFGVVQSGTPYSHTFINTELGSITITKQTNPNLSPQAFTFNLTGGATDSSILTDGQSDTYSNLLPGTYTITETIPEGWSTGVSVLCGDASYGHPTTLALAAGQDITCTFTNTQLGQIIIEKQTEPNGSPQSFHFNASYDGDGFDLTDGQSNTSSYLAADVYFVTEVVPPGWDHTNTPCSDGSYPDGISLQAGETVTCVFTNTELGNVTVVKYHDHNANGVKDGSGDEVLSGWEIWLNAAAQWTGVSGQVTFSDVMPGDYTLSEQINDGWYQSNISCGQEAGIDNNNDHPVSLAAGEDLTCYIGNYQKGSISGQKFNDLDGSGTKDLGEPGLSGWTINLDTDANGSVDATAVTDGNGNYSFINLEPDTYRIREVGQIGWTQMSANPVDIILVSGQTVTDVDFGNFRLGRIQGFKYEDTNGNGEWDGEESGINGWEICLDNENWEGEECTTTYNDEDAGDGYFEFTGLEYGDYALTEDESDSDYQRTEPTSGSYDIAIESGSGYGDENYYYYFGNAPLTDVHGYKWSDEDGDGQRGEGEDLLGGWTIFLDENGDEQLDEGENWTTTENNAQSDNFGRYSFFDLLPGDYSICEVKQDGWDQTYPIDSEFFNEQMDDYTTSYCHNITVPNDDGEYNFGNQQQQPILTITKENNTGGADKHPGDSVLFTITVTATQSAAFNVKVTDLLPGGFTYRSGSWTSNNSNGNDLKALGVTTEPTYASPGVWQLGDMAEDETVTLTYIADISADQQAGWYFDLAWAAGCKTEENCDGDFYVLSNATNPGFVADNYVGTQVNVVREPSEGVNLKVEGQVLGASTELPATGASTFWLYVAFALITGGLTFGALGWYIRRKYE